MQFIKHIIFMMFGKNNLDIFNLFKIGFNFVQILIYKKIEFFILYWFD